MNHKNKSIIQVSINTKWIPLSNDEYRITKYVLSLKACSRNSQIDGNIWYYFLHKMTFVQHFWKVIAFNFVQNFLSHRCPLLLGIIKVADHPDLNYLCQQVCSKGHSYSNFEKICLRVFLEKFIENFTYLILFFHFIFTIEINFENFKC